MKYKFYFLFQIIIYCYVTREDVAEAHHFVVRAAVMEKKYQFWRGKQKKTFSYIIALPRRDHDFQTSPASCLLQIHSWVGGRVEINSLYTFVVNIP